MPSSINPHKSLLIAAIGACVLVIVIPMILWLAHGRADPEDAWEQEHHAELVQLTLGFSLMDAPAPAG